MNINECFSYYSVPIPVERVMELTEIALEYAKKAIDYNEDIK